MFHPLKGVKVAELYEKYHFLMEFLFKGRIVKSSATVRVKRLQ